MYIFPKYLVPQFCIRRYNETNYCAYLLDLETEWLWLTDQSSMIDLAILGVYDQPSIIKGASKQGCIKIEKDPILALME